MNRNDDPTPRRSTFVFRRYKRKTKGRKQGGIIYKWTLMDDERIYGPAPTHWWCKYVHHEKRWVPINCPHEMKLLNSYAAPIDYVTAMKLIYQPT